MVKFKKIFCMTCHKPIYRRKGWVNEDIKFGYNFYCSAKCKKEHRSNKQSLICANCGKSFLRIPSKISIHNYCSRECAAKVNNKQYPKRRPKTKICAGCGKEFRKSTKNLKYCSIKCRKNTEGYSVQQLIDIIKQAAEKLKRTPARRELHKIASSCRRTFGSWNNAVIAANLQPNRSHSQRMYKRTNTMAMDGHPCDSISEAIIDNWFTINNIPHERNITYPGTNHKADWAIHAKKHRIFVEYFGLVNDSPRYDRCIEIKKQLCHKHNLNLIAIYPQDLYPQKNLNAKLKNKFKHLVDF